ncbi:MAG: hypothetical protein V2A56_11515 [bacterium]
MSDLLLRGGRVVSPGAVCQADVLFRGERIELFGEGLDAPAGAENIDCSGVRRDTCHLSGTGAGARGVDGARLPAGTARTGSISFNNLIIIDLTRKGRT